MFEHAALTGASEMNIQENCPAVCKYVNAFREHPLLADHCITLDAFKKHHELSLAAPPGVKYNLDLKSLPVDA